jgi:hypothetical protein
MARVLGRSTVGRGATKIWRRMKAGLGRRLTAVAKGAAHGEEGAGTLYLRCGGARCTRVTGGGAR